MLELALRKHPQQPVPSEIESQRSLTESIPAPDHKSRLGNLALRLANKAYLGGIWLRHALGVDTKEPQEDFYPKHSAAPIRTKTPEPAPQPEAVTLGHPPNFQDETLRPSKPNVTAQPGDTPLYYDTMVRLATGSAVDLDGAVRRLLGGDSLEAMSLRLRRARALSELSQQAQLNRDDPWVGQSDGKLPFLQEVILDTPSVPQSPIVPPDPNYN